jgi:CRISPR/Cas system Type II protein with McrA/HNH and RuvC-like nuclease domain
LRRGKCAIIRTGARDILSIDHFVPLAVCPEADNVIANLQLMPLSENRRKGDSVGQPELDHALKLHRAGLISETVLTRIMRGKPAGE